jgi:hypothetical protein
VRSLGEAAKLRGVLVVEDDVHAVRLARHGSNIHGTTHPV